MFIRFLITVLGISMLMFWTLILGFWFIIQSSSNDICRSLIAVATDKEKYRYLAEWIDTSINDESILSIMELDANTGHRVDPEIFDAIGFDWSVLNLDDSIGGIQVQYSRGSEKQKNDKSKVMLVSFRQGRSFLNYYVNKPNDERSIASMNKFDKISENIYVLCEE